MMKWPVAAAGVGCLLILLPSVSSSQPNNSFEGAILLYHFDYNEDVPVPLKSSETGWLQGYRLDYIHQGAILPLYGEVLFEYTNAKTDYDGTTQNGQPLKLTSKHTLQRVEADGGYSFRKIGGTPVSLTPYSGIAYRRWDRLLGDTEPSGNREVYSWWYVPLGIRIDYQIQRGLELSLDFSARFMFSGQINFDYEHSDPRLNSPVADLGSQVGWKVSVPVEYEFTKTLSAAIRAWYETSSIGKSNHVIVTVSGNPQLDVYEPSSSTNLFGFDFVLRVRI